jgi:hypothetical protein
VETWFDNSGKGRHVGQAVQAARPRIVRVGRDWLIRFDGADDHLRCTGLNRSLDPCTVFVVAAPHARASKVRVAGGAAECSSGAREDAAPIPPVLRSGKDRTLRPWSGNAQTECRGRPRTRARP